MPHSKRNWSLVEVKGWRRYNNDQSRKSLHLKKAGMSSRKFDSPSRAEKPLNDVILLRDITYNRPQVASMARATEPQFYLVSMTYDRYLSCIHYRFPFNRVVRLLQSLGIN